MIKTSPSSKSCLLHAVVPDSIFLTYVSSQNSPFAAWTALAFERTEGRSVDHIQLRSGNHFAINDWNPKSAPHQVCMPSYYPSHTSQLLISLVPEVCAACHLMSVCAGLAEISCFNHCCQQVIEQAHAATGPVSNSCCYRRQSELMPL